MTTQSRTRIVMLLLSLLSISYSFAQQSELTNLQPVLSNSPYIKVYENVLTEFQKHFANAENVRWYNIDRDYLAKFTIGDMEHRALLNRRGNLLYKISYGKEKHLPANIRKSIKSNYVEFLITAATLVEEANRNIWVINLEDNTHYVTIRVEDSEIEEIRKYDRADLPEKQ